MQQRRPAASIVRSGLPAKASTTIPSATWDVARPDRAALDIDDPTAANCECRHRSGVNPTHPTGASYPAPNATAHARSRRSSRRSAWARRAAPSAHRLNSGGVVRMHANADGEEHHRTTSFKRHRRTPPRRCSARRPESVARAGLRRPPPVRRIRSGGPHQPATWSTTSATANAAPSKTARYNAARPWPKRSPAKRSGGGRASFGRYQSG